MMSPEEVLERAAWLIKSQSERVNLQTELQKLFQLDFNDAALANAPDWVQPIKDPQPFNAIQWLVDVMAHDEPQYNIEIAQESLPTAIDPMLGQDPMSQMMAEAGGNTPGGGMGMPGMGQPPKDTRAEDMADLLENTAREVYRQNDLRCPTGLQRDELYGAFVNGMVVDKIADLRHTGKRWQAYAAKNRGKSPFYIRSINAAHIYYEFDEYGLCEVLYRYLRPIKEVQRLYGAAVEGLGGIKATSADGFVLFAEYWTEGETAKWIENVYYDSSIGATEAYFTTQTISGGYFLQKPTQNVLGFIPYSLKVARGASLFNRSNMVFPHLYSGHKSKLFIRQNMFLTVASTLAFMLVNPQMVQETDTPENPLQLDFSRPAVHGVRKGDKLTPLAMNMTKDFYDVMTLLGQKVEESTVSKVIAGQSPGGITAAAGINLLIDGGKLTISSVQGALEEVRSGTLDKVFRYIKTYPDFVGGGMDGALEMYAGGAFKNIDPLTMPDNIEINTKWTSFLPQDKALAVQTFLPMLEKQIISSDYFYGQVGVQDVITLRRQIEQDKDRVLADGMHQQEVQMQMQQQQAALMQPQMQDPNQPQAPTQTVGENALEPVTPNPMPDNANPADQLNANFNALENPMSAGG